MRLTRNMGMLVLGIWLILTGLLQVASISIAGLGIIMALLAIVAGSRSIAPRIAVSGVLKACVNRAWLSWRSSIRN